MVLVEAKIKPASPLFFRVYAIVISIAFFLTVYKLVQQLA